MARKTRNRKQAAKKATETNKLKDSRYYHIVGSLGGAAVNAVKRAFSIFPGLASRAAIKGRNQLAVDQGVQYTVKGYKNIGSSTITKSFVDRIREDARQTKRDMKAADYYDITITKHIYDDQTGLIVQSMEIM